MGTNANGVERVIVSQGNKFFFTDDVPVSRQKRLAAGTYVVRFTMETGFYLEQIENFTIPAKIYGSLEKKALRVLDTYKDRTNSTGVILTGEKGSGKTLLTKLISRKGIAQGMPTIIVNNSYGGDMFNMFLDRIDQPTIVLFDEFEKVYDDKDDQKRLLTLFDGIFSSKKLLLLTTNNYSAVDSHMHNRPGRLFYKMEFNGLDMDFVREYGETNLENKNHLKSLCIVASLVNPMNFDVLQALVEESNRYNEAPIETLQYLNIKATEYRQNLDVELVFNDHELLEPVQYQKDLNINPLQSFSVDTTPSGEQHKRWSDPENGKSHPLYEDGYEIYFHPKDMVSMDALEGKFEFLNKDYNVTAKLKRKPAVTSRPEYEKYLV